MKPQGVVWITGLSGSGKTTIAKILQSQLFERYGINPVLLDGDRLRYVYPTRFGYSEKERRQLAASYGRLALEISSQGHLVICATISLFHEVHQWNRANLPGYLEVWLRVPMEELITRDQRGLYNLRDKNNSIAGIDVSVEFPETPDIIIDNYGKTLPQKATEEIMKFLDLGE